MLRLVDHIPSFSSQPLFNFQMGSDYKSDGAVTIVVKNVRFQPLTPFLSKCNPILQSVFCAVVCFCTYFCVYAYRKPYQAVVYTEKWFGGFGFKTILSLGQLVGYTVSKFLAVKYVSEVPRTPIRILYLIV